MRLELRRSTLRPLESGDVDALVRHGNDRDVWRNLRDGFPHPYTRAEARAWIEYARSTEHEVHVGLEVDGEVAGVIGCVPLADVYRHVGETGYWLGKAHWGRGIMTEAVRAFSAWLFEHRDLVRLEAPVYEWNAASVRVLEKAGYTLEARQKRRVFKEGRHADQLLYVRLRAPEHGVAG